MKIRFGALLALLSCLAGCSAGETNSNLLTGALQQSDDRPSDASLVDAKAHYDKGSYGLAERRYRAATEANPTSIDAWLGLAASYDRLARFDLAERAYRRVTDLGGMTAAVHNNMGYHYMLRGNLRAARSHFDSALRLEPQNAVVLGNLQLLETWKTASPSPTDQAQHARAQMSLAR